MLGFREDHPRSETAETKPMSNNPLFNDDWLKLQQQYWENLTEMGRKAVGLEGTQAKPWDSNLWTSAMNNWWQALAPGASDPAKSFMDHLMQQGQAFFGAVERFTQGLPEGASGSDAAGNAWQMLNKTFEDLQKAFAGGIAGGDGSTRQMFGFWEMPLDNWQRMMSSLTPIMPGDMLRNMPHEQVKEGMNRMLSAPGLGYSREEMAQYQDLTRRAMDYQQALQEYMGFFSKLGVKSVERMRDQVQAFATSGKTIDSARTLYDNWVACCEAVYAEEVGTEDYARIYGHLVNAQMALKKRLSVMMDEYLGAMNMPTVTELRTVQDRLQETRRENKRLRREIDSIKRRMAALHGDEMQSRATPPKAKIPPPSPAAARPAVPTAKKAVARKKTVAKARPGPAAS